MCLIIPIIYGLGSIGLFLAGIRALRKIDPDCDIGVDKWKLGLISSLILFAVVLLYYQGTDTILFLSYALLMIYLGIETYADLQVGYIYTTFSKGIFALGICICIYLYGTNSRGYADVWELFLFECLLYIGLVLVQTGLRLFGRGDSWLYLSLAPFLALVNWRFPLSTLLFHMLLSAAIFLLFHLKEYDFRNMKMKREIPFAPSIASAAFLVLFIIPQSF